MTMNPRKVLVLGATLFALAACATNGPGGPQAQTKEEARQALVAFLTDAATLGREEVAFSHLAETKAVNPEVRSFATSLIAEQTPINDQIAAMAESRQVAPPTDMDGRHAMLYHRLEELRGRQFDQAYLEVQMQDRTMMIQAFQHQADSGVDPEVRSYAQAHLQGLMESLQRANALENEE